MRQLSLPFVALLLALAVAAPAGAGSEWPQEEVASWSFDTAGGGELVVNVADADVDLRTGSGGKVEIRVFLASRDLSAAKGRFEKMNFDARSSGGKVTLRADNVPSKWREWRDIGFQLRAEIFIPEQFDVDVTTDDGDIAVQRLAGRLRVRTADGDIALDRVSGAETVLMTSDGDIAATEIRSSTVEIKTSDGDISIADLDGEELDLRTSDGDITIERASGPLSASTSDGDIQVGFDCFDRTSLTTGDGDVAISAGAGLAAELDLRASEVVFHSADFSGSKSRREVLGQLNGGGPVLQVSSRDGTVVLEAL
jgi:hypothetical protein